MAKPPANIPSGPPQFTVRDLNRHPRVVLEAVREHGQVIIRARSGERYSIRPEQQPPVRVRKPRDFLESLKRMRKDLQAGGFVPPSRKDAKALARLIAGEDA